ncbi:MAG: AMP-binding protein, partial [Rhodospirillales bacterium]|nr:AMP-binding protein [Rhodospirillales bacterium]
MADAPGILPMDRFDADFHGLADIAVTPDNYAPIRGLSDIERIEGVPFEVRSGPLNSFDLIKRGAGFDSDKTALEILSNGEADQVLQRITYGALLENIIRAANLFRSLGVNKGDVVALLMPNLAETHYALWGAQVAGIAISVNWMLEPRQITEIIRTSGAKLLVALGPADGYEIWDKARAVRDAVP